MDQQTHITLNTLLSVLGMVLQFALRAIPQRNRLAEVEQRLDQIEQRVDELEQHRKKHS